MRMKQEACDALHTDCDCCASGRSGDLRRPALRRPVAVLGLDAAHDRAARQPVGARALDDRAVRARLSVGGASGGASRARGHAGRRRRRRDASGTGFVWDAGRPHRHQRSRGGGLGPGRGALCIRPGAARPASSAPRPITTSRCSARQHARVAATDRDRHVRRPQGRAVGVRDRQSVRPRPVADHRHHQRAQAPAADQRAAGKSPT